MRLTLILLICLHGVDVFSQPPKVPTRMEFAGIQLKLSEGSRMEIQEKVNSLTKSPKHFAVKVERAASYFPIVEQVFEEEGLPDDFKYLAIHESGFISDAVSTSNAVGFWQFKKATAEEMGLRVDSEVDERMNIVAATRAAANYLQQNNLLFNNWVHALQAYQMGAGGAQRSLSKIESGVTNMHITKNTYWYVITFLAHKIAFEESVNLARNSAPSMYLYKQGSGKTLKDISTETDVSLDRLEKYNKWLKAKKIPTDKAYLVVIPNFKSSDITPIDVSPTTGLAKIPASVVDNIDIPLIKPTVKKITINGLPAILSNTEISINQITENLTISSSEFASFNDILLHSPIIPDQIYYLKRKLKKAHVFYHTVKEHETLWSISQAYGVRKANIKLMNRIIKEEDEITTGRVLWLKKIRPKNLPLEVKDK